MPITTKLLFPLAILAGCGGVESQSPDASARPDAEASHDAPTPDGTPAPCDRSAPWGAPQSMVGLDNDQDYGVWLSPDELTAFVSAAGTQGQDLYTASRGSTADSFAAPARVAASTAGNDYEPVLSPDELTLYFNNDGDMLYSVRATTADTFDTSAAFLFGTDPAVDEGDAFVTPRGLYYARNFHDGNGWGIWFAPASGRGFGTPQHLSELDGTGVVEGAMTPTLTADELTIYFLSQRSGGAGQRDIWTATRTSVDAPFSTPTPVTELDTAGAEWPGAVSPDGCRLYYTGAGSPWHVYVTSKPPT